jgi:TPR repeat protein
MRQFLARLGGGLRRGLPARRKAEAEYRLGYRHLRGDGVTHDPVAAAAWLTRAAGRNHGPAQHSLSLLYITGAKGSAPAGGWLAEARVGTSAARANAGLLYPGGLDVAPDAAAAFVWAEAAARQGLADAEANLGMLYARGLGCAADYVQAASWYRRAASKGDAVGALGLGILHENGLGVSRDGAAAARWYATSAAAGNHMAATALGLLHLSGVGVAADPAAAARWLADAAARGNAIAQHRLGLLYAGGIGLASPRRPARPRRRAGGAAAPRARGFTHE